MTDVDPMFLVRQDIISAMWLYREVLRLRVMIVT